MTPVVLFVATFGSAAVAKSYVSYMKGDVNLILTIPRNGYDRIDIPNRQPGCKDSSRVCEFPGEGKCSEGNVCEVVTSGESYTQKIAKAVSAEFQKTTGRTPHLIINNVHRSKMDANREIKEAAQGNTEAIAAYKEYHNTIDMVKSSFGKEPGLLIDIHGQAHKQNSTEIGYLISRTALNEGKLSSGRLSIKALVKRMKLDLEDYIYGINSLGALFEMKGYKAIPSPRQPSPGKDLYFTGGYTTKVYGSNNGGNVDAIQVEIPGEVRYTGGSTMRNQFSKDLAHILGTFFTVNYESQYISYTKGDVNLILTVPHNGYDRIDIPDRQQGCKDSSKVCQFPGKGKCSKENECRVVTRADAYTQKVARAVFDEFQRFTGRTPHLIINNVHRSKMDPNREINEAAQGNTEAMKAYKEYHNTIEMVKASFGEEPGLVIDIHGQAHKQNSTELGYLISKTALNEGELNTGRLSIKALVSKRKVEVEDYIFGKDSLGALFEEKGYKALPSPRQPAPGKDLYFTGGYTTKIYGSNNGGSVDAIQVEIPGEIRYTGGSTLRNKFSKDLAHILETYFSANYETLIYF